MSLPVFGHHNWSPCAKIQAVHRPPLHGVTKRIAKGMGKGVFPPSMRGHAGRFEDNAMITVVVQKAKFQCHDAKMVLLEGKC